MHIKRIIKSILVSGFIAIGVTTSLNASLNSVLSNQEIPAIELERSLKVPSIQFPFIKNEGQADSRISFYRPTTTGMAFITTTGELLYNLNYGGEVKKSRGTLRVQFKDGKAKPVGFVEYNPRINFYLGNKFKNWRSRSTIYDSVKLGEVWPGVDVLLHSKNSRVGKYFEVQPGGDLSRIQMQISYAKSLRIQSDGKLVVKTNFGPVVFSEPNAYQVKNGKKFYVPLNYRVDKLTYGFEVEAYDSSLALYIDPLVMVGRANN